jgi:hypothetical protein
MGLKRRRILFLFESDSGQKSTRLTVSQFFSYRAVDPFADSCRSRRARKEPSPGFPKTHRVSVRRLIEAEHPPPVARKERFEKTHTMSIEALRARILQSMNVSEFYGLLEAPFNEYEFQSVLHSLRTNMLGRSPHVNGYLGQVRMPQRLPVTLDIVAGSAEQSASQQDDVRHCGLSGSFQNFCKP